MSDPCAELQPAIRAVLKASPALQAVFGQGKPVKVYDIPPVDTPPPYIVIGDDSVVADYAECFDGAEVTANVHVWSLTDPPGLGQAKDIGAAVQAALLTVGDLPSFHLTCALPKLARYMTDTDGKTAHGVVTVTFDFDPL